MGHLDELFDDLGRLVGPIPIALQAELQQLRELGLLYDVGLEARLDFVLQQALEQLDRQVALLHVAHVLQEFLGQDADVGAVQAGSPEDIDHLGADHRFADDLPERVLLLLVAELLARGAELGQSRLHGL